MTTYKFGDIVSAPYPYTDQSGNKKRPAVVISSDIYNQQQRDIITMPITSQIKKFSMTCQIFIQSWKEVGLLYPSVIKPVILTMEKELIIKKLGTLQNEDKVQILNTLKIILASY